MFKRLILLAMTIGAASAWGVPAAHAVELTKETGTKVSPGEFITLVSENHIIHAGPNTVQCDVWGITGEVVINGPETVTISKTSVTTEPTPCNFNGNPIVHVRAALGHITLETNTKGAASNHTVEAELTTINVTCHWSAASLPLTFNTTDISFGGAGNNLAGKAPCGPGTTNADFQIFDDAHTEQWTIDH